MTALLRNQTTDGKGLPEKSNGLSDLGITIIQLFLNN
jgi:hypothetical protein